jgi:arylsulfatase A-like enzyme/Flp pilus assembly protein TadD
MGTAPNVLLITIDTLRADHVGSYGYSKGTTPTLDALAAEGVRFATPVSPTPLTLPSHASIFTGRFPPGHAVRHNGMFRLDPSVETLAERMQHAGYATAAFVGSAVLAKRYGLAQGFDVYDATPTREKSAPSGSRESPAEVVTDRALRWLEATDRPFFLWVHYSDPHARYTPPSPFSERFTDHLYDGEIAYVDSEIGRVLEGLRKSGRFEQTFIVVTSDHGESLGEHGEATHGYALYDPVLLVPLIFRGPDIPTSRVVKGVVRTVDIAPTLLWSLGLNPLPDIDGEDLAPLWVPGAPPSHRWGYAETLATQFEQGWSPLFAIRSSDFLYVRSPRPELYNLKSDPEQLDNLVEAGTESASKIVRFVDPWVDEILAREPQGQKLGIDRETRVKLLALGYALPDGPAEETGIDPKDGRAALNVYLEGTAALDAAAFEHARVSLEKALEGLPNSAAAHAGLSRANLYLGRLEEARTQAVAAVRLVPQSAAYHAHLGEVRRLLGDREGAVGAFQLALRLDPTDPDAHVGLGWIHAQDGNLEQAEQHAQQALEADPYGAMVRTRLGILWGLSGRPGRTLALLEEAVRVEPTSEFAHMMLAVELARLGLEAESERSLAEAGPYAKDAALLNALAAAHAVAGNAEGAETVDRELLRLHPEFGPACERQAARGGS